MQINEGDQIPTFQLRNHMGEVFNSSSIIGKKIVVLFFYPKNFTPGCTKEACSFRNDFSEFKNRGAQVVGISSDNVISHQKFSEKYHLPFPTLADEKGIIRKKLGVKNIFFGLIPTRETWVIDEKGNLHLKIKNSKASLHSAKALEVVEKLTNEK